MRRSMIFLVVLMSFGNTVAQYIPNGTYEFDGGFVQSRIVFQPKHRFVYQYNSCTGGYKGKGIYRLKSGILELQFVTDSTEESFLQRSYHASEFQGDSVLIVLNTINKEDSASSTFIRSEVYDSHNKEINFGYTTMGMQTFKIAAKAFPIRIAFWSIGYQPENIYLNKAANYQLVHPFRFDYIKTLQTGDILKFELEEIDEASMVIKPLGEEMFRTWDRKY